MRRRQQTDFPFELDGVVYEPPPQVARACPDRYYTVVITCVAASKYEHRSTAPFWREEDAQAHMEALVNAVETGQKTFLFNENSYVMLDKIIDVGISWRELSFDSTGQPDGYDRHMVARVRGDYPQGFQQPVES